MIFLCIRTLTLAIALYTGNCLISGKSACNISTDGLSSKPSKTSKEKDVKEMFKLNQGQCSYRARVFFLLLLEWKSCLHCWQRGESQDGCYDVLQRHWAMPKFILQIPHLKWKFSTLFFGSTQTRLHMEAHTQEPLLMAILISLSKYQWGFVLYNDSERRPPTSLWSHSHIHTSAHTAIFRVMQY